MLQASFKISQFFVQMVYVYSVSLLQLLLSTVGEICKYNNWILNDLLVFGFNIGFLKIVYIIQKILTHLAVICSL